MDGKKISEDHHLALTLEIPLKVMTDVHAIIKAVGISLIKSTFRFEAYFENRKDFYQTETAYIDK